MKMIEDQTKLKNRDCIKFIESEKNDYLYIHSGTGCWSQVGRVKGKQEMSLQKAYCLQKETVAHEFIHALGN